LESENKAYATSYCFGTRNAEDVTIPVTYEGTTNLLTASQSDCETSACTGFTADEGVTLSRSSRSEWTHSYRMVVATTAINTGVTVDATAVLGP
jgi:hypothetical protein